MDPIGIAELRDFFKSLSQNRGKTILISSHILSEISLLADDIGIIHDGVLTEKSAVDILNDIAVKSPHTCGESLEDYFKHITGGTGIA